LSHKARLPARRRPEAGGAAAGYGIGSVEDLLFHLPLRYQDRTRVTPIGALQDGSEVVIEGEIALVSTTGGGRRRSLLVKLQDGTGTATLRFFTSARRRKMPCTSATGCAVSAACAAEAGNSRR
jgi:ATP-dependent DNA helicase RecG